jgi:hypothetical protein
MTSAIAAKTKTPHPQCGKAVDNGGLRYGAMESALRPPLPTATQSGHHRPDVFANPRRSKSVSA